MSGVNIMKIEGAKLAELFTELAKTLNSSNNNFTNEVDRNEDDAELQEFSNIINTLAEDPKVPYTAVIDEMLRLTNKCLSRFTSSKDNNYLASATNYLRIINTRDFIEAFKEATDEHAKEYTEKGMTLIQQLEAHLWSLNKAMESIISDVSDLALMDLPGYIKRVGALQGLASVAGVLNCKLRQQRKLRDSKENPMLTITEDKAALAS